MEDKDITTNIILEAKYLNNNIQENILNKIQELKDSCTEEHGYIININNDINIISNKIIDNTSDTLFKTKFRARVLKPAIGMELEAKINMIFNHGIFCQYLNLPILIPYTKLVGYEYIDKKFKKGEEEFQIGSSINVRITDIRYHNKNINCIASLKK